MLLATFAFGHSSALPTTIVAEIRGGGDMTTTISGYEWSDDFIGGKQEFSQINCLMTWRWNKSETQKLLTQEQLDLVVDSWGGFTFIHEASSEL